MAPTPAHCVDTHQHLWVLSERAYDWIVPEYGILNADYRPEDVEELSRQGSRRVGPLQQAE